VYKSKVNAIIFEIILLYLVKKSHIKGNCKEIEAATIFLFAVSPIGGKSKYSWFVTANNCKIKRIKTLFKILFMGFETEFNNLKKKIKPIKMLMCRVISINPSTGFIAINKLIKQAIMKIK